LALTRAGIREAIDKIERYTAGLDREGFEADDKSVDAVVRNLEIIGEAARQMPEEFTQRNPQIESFRCSRCVASPMR
jgi:uncharacterized protein with HEPN domain